MIPLPNRVERWGLKLCLYLHRWAYEKANIFAVRYYGGVHPKHFLTGIHDFFLKHSQTTDTVLDIGCGFGMIAADVAGKAKSVVAFDIDPAKIAEAKRLRSRPNLTYYVGEATKDLPKDDVFDVAISSGVLEHLHNPEEHLRAVARSARRLLLRVPNLKRSWTVLLCRELGMPYTCDPDHQCEYTVDTARTELERNGWVVKEIDTSEGEIWMVAQSLQLTSPVESETSTALAATRL